MYIIKAAKQSPHLSIGAAQTEHENDSCHKNAPKPGHPHPTNKV